MRMPPLPNFSCMRRFAASRSRICRATYCSSVSFGSLWIVSTSAGADPPADEALPAAAGAAARFGSSVGSSRPSTWARRRSR